MFGDIMGMMGKLKETQEKVEATLAAVFGKWGSILTHHTHKVFWISLLVFILFSGGMSQQAAFADESEIWTPKNNPSMQANRRQKEMFPSEGGFISMLFEVKDPSS